MAAGPPPAGRADRQGSHKKHQQTDLFDWAQRNAIIAPPRRNGNPAPSPDVEGRHQSSSPVVIPKAITKAAAPSPIVIPKAITTQEEREARGVTAELVAPADLLHLRAGEAPRLRRRRRPHLPILSMPPVARHRSRGWGATEFTTKLSPPSPRPASAPELACHKKRRPSSEPLATSSARPPTARALLDGAPVAMPAKLRRARAEAQADPSPVVGVWPGEPTLRAELEDMVARPRRQQTGAVGGQRHAGYHAGAPRRVWRPEHGHRLGRGSFASGREVTSPSCLRS
ncbi:unnamed protein product [Prorocentrum cordatum]|uniref:Uncharacterized protein n=1 Tax=Prorocentrum cordatum TaxID=2364126 RepID=A0ABN9TCG2_9DINO|nr:unnamed protein product [Polarella glacialis]